MPATWCNGQWHDGPLPIPPADRGLANGLGLFETMLALDGRPVFADRHLARFRAACGRIGWPFPEEDIVALCRETLARNGLTSGRARLRITLTAGTGAPGQAGAGDDRVFLITAAPAGDVPDAIRVNVSPWRLNERSPLAGLKTTSYAERLVAVSQAREEGYDETLMFNTAGFLCEAAMANVFLVSGGILFTPSLETGCLPGVTRAWVLETAASLGIPTRECLLPDRDVSGADEVFLTSAVRGVLPVSRVGGRELAACPVASRLRAAWREAVTG